MDGWSTTVLSELAGGPLSLTELDRRTSVVSYPTIERCLETMRLAGQLETGARRPTGTPYALTGWMRRGVGPLTLAARWEHRRNAARADPIRREDVAGAVALAAPLVTLPAGLSGTCQLAATLPSAGGCERFLAAIELRAGEISFGPVYPDRKPDAWASATVDTWFALLIDAEPRGLRRAETVSSPQR